jgi:tetratricopeptide (TPR) repeat protein
VAPAAPSQIGKYEVIEILGRGGMGVVYLGFDRHLGRRVAIKTLTEGFVQDPEMLKRFYREATKTGALMHPNIVIVYDLGEQDGFPYIVMEYVSGEPLDKIIRSGRPLTIISKLRVMEQVCLALGYAHRNDVIHRDVKPANVIVQQDDKAKLLDFGIAHHEQQDRNHRLTKAGNVLGTMQYMAPERWRGELFDGRSDIFSAGVMLYELLAGHLPYHGEDAALFHQILHEPCPPLGKYIADYPVTLDAIIQRALSKNPNDRQGNAEEMAAEIAAVAEDLRKEQGAQMFQRAERFVNAEDYLRARDLLSQLIKLDSKNVDARKLLATVQSSLAVRQRAEQVQQLKIQAADVLDEKLYPQAISLLEQALQLDPSDAEAQQKIEAVRKKKRVHDEIESCLRKAHGEREKRQFEAAQASLQRAMSLDPNDSTVKAAWHELTAQIEDDARRRKVKQILDSAQGELRARRFSAATKLLQEAGEVDPGNAEIVRLLQMARTAQEQEQRRKFVEQVQNEVSAAVTALQIAAASQTVDKALQQVPTEPSLLKLKAQLDRQSKDLQIRTRVDETVRRCYPLMESSPQQALALVHEQLREFPSEERLVILQSAIEERLAHLKLEEARSRYMARAHEAIRSQRYREAVQVLEACHSEGILSNEITDLLEFARHEARREERSALIETTAAKAHALIGQGSYDQVISLLEPVVSQYDDPSLRVVLEKARSERHSEQLRFQSVLATLQQLVSFQQWEEAIAFLEQQPEAVRENDALRSALADLREANDQEGRILQATGVAYAALHRADLPAAHQQTEAMRRVQGPSELATRLINRLEARVTQVADQVVANCLSDARQALQQHDPRRAVDALAESSNAKDYSTLEIRKSWQELRKRAGRAKLLGRVGIRVKPTN